MSATRLAALVVPGDAAPWSALGFTVVDDVIGFANGAIRLCADRCTLAIDRLDGANEPPTDLEGIPIEGGEPAVAGRHGNGAVELDHLVIMTDSLERTSAAVESTLGLEQRRVRETEAVRQAFHRFADNDDARGCIVEIVENPRVGRPEIWGIVVTVEDLDETVRAGNGLIGEPKAAVQPGRRIATVSRSAGLPIAFAVMSR